MIFGPYTLLASTSTSFHLNSFQIFEDGHILVPPYWFDVYYSNTHTEPEDGGRILWYGADDSKATKQRALHDIQRVFPSVSHINHVAVATWENVGYYNDHHDKVINCSI